MCELRYDDSLIKFNIDLNITKQIAVNNGYKIEKVHNIPSFHSYTQGNQFLQKFNSLLN